MEGASRTKIYILKKMIVIHKKALLHVGIYLFITSFFLSVLRQRLATYSSKQARVLILTYMRSGSSLTGDILQDSPGSFYVYEPLRALCPSSCKYVIPTDLTYANGTKKWAPIPFTKEAISTLYKWFTCDIRGLPTVGLYDGIFLEKGQQTKMFLPCYKNETLRTMNHTHAMNKCTEKLHDECRTSPIKIIKTIRTRFSNVKQLLEILPDLKIIHVVRDPRATLFSQSLLQLHSHVQICSENNNGRARCSGRLCERLSSDLQEKELLAKMFPGRIMTVKYEDLARDPIETSQNMYDFIGVEMTSRTKLFIYQKTMAGSKSDCSICSTRSNSSAHVDRWKQAMDKEFIDIVNRKCKSVLKRQGYEV